MTDFDKYCMSFHLHNALRCITDGKHDLAAHNVEQAVKIMDRSGEMKNLTNLELIEQLKKVTIELENREYLKGIRFNTEKIVQRAFENAFKKKTANELRHELIQRARKFVEEYGTKSLGHAGNRADGNQTALHHWYETVFHTKGNRITAIVYWLSGGTERQSKSRHIGRSNCSPADVFNEWIGKAIALARALEIDIPVEFLRAVQPDEKVIGMKVYDEGTYGLTKQKIIIPNDKWAVDGQCVLSSTSCRRATIIDDSNAEYKSEGN